jgi:hypothetical protein
MAVSDILYTTTAVPRRVVDINFARGRWLIEGDFGHALCKLAPFIQAVSLEVSFYTCIFIAIDRYCAVAHPFRGGFSRSRLKYILQGIWVSAVIINAIELYSNRLVSRAGDLMFCVVDFSALGVSNLFALRVQAFVFLTLFFGIPIPVITVLYFLIVFKLGRHIVPDQPLDLLRIRRERINKQVLKMSVAIIGIYFLGWVMYAVLSLLWALGKPVKSLSPGAYMDLVFSAAFLAQSSCIYNFCIYVVFTAIYKDNFRYIISKCFCFLRCLGTHRTSRRVRPPTTNRPATVIAEPTIQMTGFRSTNTE